MALVTSCELANTCPFTTGVKAAGSSIALQRRSSGGQPGAWRAMEENSLELCDDGGGAVCR